MDEYIFFIIHISMTLLCGGTTKTGRRLGGTPGTFGFLFLMFCGGWVLWIIPTLFDKKTEYDRNKKDK